MVNADGMLTGLLPFWETSRFPLVNPGAEARRGLRGVDKRPILNAFADGESALLGRGGGGGNVGIGGTMAVELSATVGGDGLS